MFFLLNIVYFDLSNPNPALVFGGRTGKTEKPDILIIMSYNNGGKHGKPFFFGWGGVENSSTCPKKQVWKSENPVKPVKPGKIVTKSTKTDIMDIDL